MSNDETVTGIILARLVRANSLGDLSPVVLNLRLYEMPDNEKDVMTDRERGL